MTIYYTKLFEMADKRKAKIDNHIKLMKSIYMEHTIHREELQYAPKEKQLLPKEETAKEKEDPIEIKTDNGGDYYSTSDEDKQSECQIIENRVVEEEEEEIIDSSLDVINANVELKDKNANVAKLSANIQMAIDNFEAAKKNRQRVMTEELGMNFLSFLKISYNICFQ